MKPVIKWTAIIVGGLLLLFIVTFGPNQRQGTRESFIAKALEGAKVERLSDWMTSNIDLEEVIKKLGE